MTNAIEFLARVGSDSTLRYASAAEVDRLAASASIAAPIRAAMASGNTARLGEVLGAREAVCCIVAVPDDGGDEKDDGEKPQG